jgi:hypothetical protein
LWASTGKEQINDWYIRYVKIDICTQNEKVDLASKKKYSILLQAKHAHVSKANPKPNFDFKASVIMLKNCILEETDYETVTRGN